MDKTNYFLPDLAYGYQDLAPWISEEQLKIHHQKHHQAYVNAANSAFEKIDKARLEGGDFDVKAILKELSFNVGGHLLHSLFWENLAPQNKGGGGEPKGALAGEMKQQFGSFERFKKEFSQTAVSCEGSGWAALTFDKASKRLLLMQIEKHNANIYPALSILLILDVFEHAYYIDYKNERAKFVESFWNIVNWETVERRFGQM